MALPALPFHSLGTTSKLSCAVFLPPPTKVCWKRTWSAACTCQWPARSTPNASCALLTTNTIPSSAQTYSSVAFPQRTASRTPSSSCRSVASSKLLVPSRCRHRVKTQRYDTASRCRPYSFTGGFCTVLEIFLQGAQHSYFPVSYILFAIPSCSYIKKCHVSIIGQMWRFLAIHHYIIKLNSCGRNLHVSDDLWMAIWLWYTIIRSAKSANFMT